MTFAHPGWLWAAPGVLLALVAVWLWSDARRQRALARFAAPHLAVSLTRSVSPRLRATQRVLFALALLLLCVALAGPRAGFRLETVHQSASEILFAVDTSRSMLTSDVKPNRLTRAKLAIDDLLSQLQGDAVGLVAFAGSAFLECPITLDHEAFAESVAALDTHVIPHGGTDIASAIREATVAFRGRADASKVLVLITDGEDLAGEALQAAQAAAREGVHIDTVGVGTPGGDLIALPPEEGGGFLKDREGRLVKSRLDESTLQAIAHATGGRYVSLASESGGLEALYREVLAPHAHQALEARTERIYQERFAWPLAGALLALLASVLLPTRRAVRGQSAGREPGGDRAYPPTPTPTPTAPTPAPAGGRAALLRSLSPLLIAAALLGLSAPRPAQAGDSTVARRHYNAGTAAYRAGRFEQSVAEFRASLAADPSGDERRLAEQEDTYYNLGNGLYRWGEQSAARDPKRTEQAWREAVAAYDAALELKPGDADGRFNRDVVKRRLEELEQAKARSAGQRSPSSQGGSSGGSSSSQGSSASQSSSTSQSNAASQGQSSSQGSQSAAASNSSADSSQGSGQSGSEAKSAEASGNGTAAPDAKPPSQGKVAAAAGNSESPSASAPARITAKRAPGAMSDDEARELLDSVKDEERRLPVAPSASKDGPASTTHDPARDW